MATASLSSNTIRVTMAGIESGVAPDVLETLLGSCVGITLWCRDTQRGALAHAMLSDANGKTDQPGRFVDTAIPFMIDALIRKGARREKLVAKLCGGSNMFKRANTAQDVGLKNIEKTREVLRHLNIPVISEHVGGTAGRVIYFDLESGNIKVKVGRDVVAEI